MQRTIAVTAVTTLLIALAATTLTGAAPAAPRWPPASLDYWTEAEPLLATLAEQSGVALNSAGKPDATDVLSDTVTAVTAAVAAIADLEPPPAMLPTHVQLSYAGEVCQRATKFAQTTTFDGVAALANVNLIATFGLECRRSLRDVSVESARYAATVGGFPKP